MTAARRVRAAGRRARDLRARARLLSQPLSCWQPVSTLVLPAHVPEQPRFPAVDVHNHLGRWLRGGADWEVPDVGALLGGMDDLQLTTVVNLDGRWGAELEANLDRYDRAHPGRFATFCQLDWSMLRARDASERLVRSLRDSAAQGAVGVKVWKDLGLSVTDARGQRVLPDDRRLAPVWDAAGELGLPVLMHVADPVAFFAPVDNRNERLEELLRHPGWSQAELGEAGFHELLVHFERMVGEHRGTTFIAAHLAGWAENLSWVSALLHRNPNLYVDIAARAGDLGRQPRRARAFLLEHADRSLFGTDAFGLSTAQYHIYFRMLETADECFPYSGGRPEQGRWSISGLDLPDVVLSAIYRDNARRLLRPGGR